jgi:hypothetical protein
VERASYLEWDYAGAPGGSFCECGKRGQRTGRHNLPAAIAVCGGQAVLSNRCQHVGLNAANYRTHACCLARRCLSHGAAAHADKLQRVALAEHARGCCGGELANRVTRNAYAVERDALAECAPGEQACCDDEWLRDLSIANRVGVARGAVRNQVNACALRGECEKLRCRIVLQPLGQKARCL